MSHFVFHFSQGFIIVCSLYLLFLSISKIIKLHYVKKVKKPDYRYYSEQIKGMYKFINSINKQGIEKDISTVQAPPPSPKTDILFENSLQYPLITASLETANTAIQGYSYSSSITAYSFNHKTKEMLGITDELDSSTIENSDVSMEKNVDVLCEDIYKADKMGCKIHEEQETMECHESVNSDSDELIYKLYEYRQLVRVAENKLKILLRRKNYYYVMILYCVCAISVYSLLIGLFYKCGFISVSLFDSCSRLVYIVMTDVQHCSILMMNTMFIYVSTLSLSNITEMAKGFIKVFFTIFITASIAATPISYLLTNVSCTTVDVRRDIIQSSVILSISMINLVTFSFSIKLALGKLGYIIFYSFNIMLETIGVKKKKRVSGRRKTDLEDKYQAKRRLKNNLSILLIVSFLLNVLGVYHLIRGIMELHNPNYSLIHLGCENMEFRFRYIIQDVLKFVILFWYLGIVNAYMSTEFKNRNNLEIHMCKISRIMKKENNH